MSDEQIVQLDPETVLAAKDDNPRWGLKNTTVENLMESILEHGGVLENVEVTEIAKTDPAYKDGFRHRLTFGFNRHEAVSRLNKEQNAGLTLPAVVRESEEGAARIRRQVAENNDRESLSPMDKAVAINRLLGAGVPKAEVRRIFKSAGGRKGNTVQPMSNSMLNILLNLLELPKAIQEKVHLGIIGVEGAYMLGRVPADKRAAVVESAEASRLKQIDMEEGDEEKLLKTEARVTEAEEKVSASETALIEAKAELEQAEANKVEKDEAYAVVQNKILLMTTPAGPAEVEQVKAAEADKKAAAKLVKDAKNKIAKITGEKSKAADTVQSIKDKLEAARKAQKKGVKKPIGKAAVKKAAAAVGTKTGIVALNIGDIRQTVKDLSAGKYGADDRTAAVAQCFKDCFDGKDTDKQTAERLNALLDAMGAKLPPKAKAEPPAAPDVKQGPKAVKK